MNISHSKKKFDPMIFLMSLIVAIVLRIMVIS